MKDDNFDDYFDEADAPASTPSTTPQPSVTASEPEEDKHVDFTDDIADDAAKAAAEGQPKKRKSHFWAWALTIIIIGLGVTCYFRYFNPYITEARVTGYVTQIERRGMIFKTFEYRERIDRYDPHLLA